MTENLFKGYGRECELCGDNFVEIQNVLYRIGILNHKKTHITQTAHIFQKRGKYAIFHFKELFLFDGKPADYSSEDKERFDVIYGYLLTHGGLIKSDNISNISRETWVERGEKLGLSFFDEDEYKRLGLKTIQKYTIGSKRKKR